ncbi:hypothetical protein B0H17DRAFT_340747 [Mycena rosella]|uniref:Uncharacterized protein n=1 Tax=Mycena rosella TaxID=1033263 RepID=A0AAD7GJJ3_MYCRO|nr:hypothetical protein B0H17DRAFT_340747 [Mycena rosella]
MKSPSHSEIWVFGRVLPVSCWNPPTMRPDSRTLMSSAVPSELQTTTPVPSDIHRVTSAVPNPGHPPLRLILPTPNLRSGDFTPEHFK